MPERNGGFVIAPTIYFEAAGPVRVALSAVIEETDGTKSYWALRHPPGKPDFHHPDCFALALGAPDRSEEHTSELQSLMRISYDVFCLKKKNTDKKSHHHTKII